jgi:hypothetical protein
MAVYIPVNLSVKELADGKRQKAERKRQRAEGREKRQKADGRKKYS